MERAKLGIDGDCGFAMLGKNIQDGECEFVEIMYEPNRPNSYSEIVAAKKALIKLRKSLNAPNLPYYFDISHPYGRY